MSVDLLESSSMKKASESVDVCEIRRKCCKVLVNCEIVEEMFTSFRFYEKQLF